MGDTSPRGRQDTAEESQNPCLAHHFSPTVSSYAGSGGRHVHSGGFQKLPSGRWGRRRWRQAQTGPALEATPFSTHPTGHPGLYTHRAPRPPESPGPPAPTMGCPPPKRRLSCLSPRRPCLVGPARRQPPSRAKLTRSPCASTNTTYAQARRDTWGSNGERCQAEGNSLWVAPWTEVTGQAGEGGGETGVPSL